MKITITTILTMLLITSAWATGVYRYYNGNPTDPYYERLSGSKAYGIRIDDTGFTTITKIRISVDFYNYSATPAQLMIFDIPRPGGQFLNYPIRIHNIITIFTTRPPAGQTQWYTADNLNWSAATTRPIYIAVVNHNLNGILDLHQENNPPISGKSFRADLYCAGENCYIYSIKPLTDKDWFIEVWTNEAQTGISSSSLGRVKSLYH